MPVLYGLSVVTLAFHASSVLGHWPRMNLDDPKWIDAISLHYGFCYGLLGFSILGLGAIPLLTPLLKYMDPEISLAWRAGGMIAAWVFLIVLVSVDPAQIFGWFFD